MGWMERRDKAAGIALASALVIVALSILMGGVSARQVAGMLIAIPSAVMASYYVLDREAYDRLYGFGLFAVIAMVGLAVYGASPRIIVAAIILLVAVLVIAWSTEGKKAGKR